MKNLKYDGLTIFEKDNQWIVEANNNNYHLKSENDFAKVLILLELPLEEVCTSLGNEFPYLKVILAALASGSNYWIEHAFTWLDNLQPNHEIIVKLSEIVDQKTFSQKNRHLARKLIKATTT